MRLGKKKSIGLDIGSALGATKIVIDYLYKRKYFPYSVFDLRVMDQRDFLYAAGRPVQDLGGFYRYEILIKTLEKKVKAIDEEELTYFSQHALKMWELTNNVGLDFSVQSAYFSYYVGNNEHGIRFGIIYMLIDKIDWRTRSSILVDKDMNIKR